MKIGGKIGIQIEKTRKIKNSENSSSDVKVDTTKEENTEK